MANDIITDIETNEPKITSGDFVIGFSDLQNLEDLMELNPGELKHEPLAGVGVDRMIRSRLDEIAVVSRTRSQMRSDGWVIDDVYLDGQEIVAIGSRNE